LKVLKAVLLLIQVADVKTKMAKIIMISGFGASLTWGTCVIRW